MCVPISRQENSLITSSLHLFVAGLLLANGFFKPPVHIGYDANNTRGYWLRAPHSVAVLLRGQFSDSNPNIFVDVGVMY